MINVFGCSVGEEELEEIKKCLDAQWLGIGKKVELLETLLAALVGNPDFVLVNSGSNALQVAIEALELPGDTEVIVPAITWVSCATAVELAGLVPVFADVDYDTLNVDQNCLHDCLSNKTSAIMLVHYSGMPCIIPEFHLPVISDCAHAIATLYDGGHIGNRYDISVFSFDAVKNLAIGEMGGVSSPDKKLTENVRNLRYCGIRKSGYEASTEKNKWWEYELKKPFPKMLPNDIGAAIGLAQLKKLWKLQERRKQIWDIYQNQLKDVSWLVVPPEIPDNIQHSYFTYFVKVNKNRDGLAKYLLENGIYTTVRYQPLHLINRYRRGKRLPVAERLNDTLLNLPLHPRLTDNELEYIIERVKSFK